jgi:hypothetical protein
MSEVVLSPWEFKCCVDVANARNAVSLDSGSDNSKSMGERNFMRLLEHNVLGACGEMVVCKALGWFWSPSVNTFHRVADIGRNVEARTTSRQDGCLIVRDNDPDDRYYVLVIGEAPAFHIAGWIKGGDAKRDEWLRDPGLKRSAWFVPQDKLKPLPEREM